VKMMNRIKGVKDKDSDDEQEENVEMTEQ